MTKNYVFYSVPLPLYGCCGHNVMKTKMIDSLLDELCKGLIRGPVGGAMG